MSASLWWLAVRMCCVFVLDLMPNLLSNNDCTGFVSEEKSGKKPREGALIPHCYRGTVSQQEPYEALVWFWDFVNVSETCQSPWFIMACCCLRSPGAYLKRVPERGDRQYVRTYVLKSMFTYLKWTCVSRQFTDTFSTLLTRDSRRAIQS